MKPRLTERLISIKQRIDTCQMLYLQYEEAKNSREILDSELDRVHNIWAGVSQE